MADEYVTLEELQRRVQKRTLSDEDTAELNAIREGVSRTVDDYLEVAPGYFIPPTEPTTKRIYGSPNSFLLLPSPVYGDVTIDTVVGYTVPNFDVEGSSLIALTEDGAKTELLGWTAPHYDITGLWGYEEIPPQLKEAVLLIASRIYRERPENGYEGLVTNMQGYQGVISGGFPSMARIILDALKRSLSNEAASSSAYIA
jgi:hypothetical protein